MPWAKLSDDFHSHRLIRRAGLDGAGLFALALSYCAKYLTDGIVDDEWLVEMVPSVTKRRKILSRLVELGLFKPVEGGYVIPSYLLHNPSRADAETKRQAQREGGRKGAQHRWGGSSSDGLTHGSSHGSSLDGPNAPSRTRMFGQGVSERSGET